MNFFMLYAMPLTTTSTLSTLYFAVLNLSFTVSPTEGSSGLLYSSVASANIARSFKIGFIFEKYVLLISFFDNPDRFFVIFIKIHNPFIIRQAEPPA